LRKPESSRENPRISAPWFLQQPDEEEEIGPEEPDED
jgi:hypothetical protein